jgi:hypothetical protein
MLFWFRQSGPDHVAAASLLRTRHFRRRAVVRLSGLLGLHLVDASARRLWLTVEAAIGIVSLLICGWCMLLAIIVLLLWRDLALLMPIWLLLLTVLRVIHLSGSVVSSADPSSAIVWLHAAPAAPAGRDAAEEEEQDDEAHYDDGKCHPSTPIKESESAM